MRRFNNTPGAQSAWTDPLAGTRASASPSSSKCLHISIYDGSESPMILLRRLESLSGRIHRAAMQVRGKPYNGIGQNTVQSVAILSIKVEFWTADAAKKALNSILSKESSTALAKNARVVAAALPSFSLDEEDALVDLRSLHDTIGLVRHGAPLQQAADVCHRDCSAEQRMTTNATNTSSADVLYTGNSIKIPETRPRSCGSEGGSYSSSSARSAGSSTGSNSSARNGRYIREDDSSYSPRQKTSHLDYNANKPMSLRMADILDDYEDLALEISKFDLITPTNDRGDAPWKGNSANWGLVSANGAIEPPPYLRSGETYGLSQRREGEGYRDEYTPRASPLVQSFGVAIGSPGNLQQPTSAGSNYEMRADSRASPPNSKYHHDRKFFAGTQKPQHTRESSYSSTTSQSRHSDYQSYDSKSTSSHSSTSTPSKRSHKKSSQDKRVYVVDPHKGPRPTDWMLSEETLKSRAARDARFMQIVAAGLAPGRTKAGWTQARRPGKRDRDAAKAKLREMEEEKERERLRRLLGEDARPSTSVAC